MKPKNNNSFYSDRVPNYIIINQYEQAFIGLMGGYPQWGYNLEKAKQYDEESKINGMRNMFPEYELEKFEI
jgi:hypothetical protein